MTEGIAGNFFYSLCNKIKKGFQSTFLIQHDTTLIFWEKGGALDYRRGQKVISLPTPLPLKQKTIRSIYLAFWSLLMRTPHTDTQTD